MNDALRSASIDVRYALRQLRHFGDVRRAVDALERAEETLDRAASATLDELGRLLASGADACHTVEGD